MSFKRQVVSALGKEELLAIGGRLDLEVAARVTVDELRDAVAGSKRVRLSEIVAESLSRDTLKAICVACGLDDTGKEKAPLLFASTATTSSIASSYATPITITAGRRSERSRQARASASNAMTRRKILATALILSRKPGSNGLSSPSSSKRTPRRVSRNETG